MATYIAHHGILGQKWGKRNGPPYPLDAEDHSAAEKLAAGLKRQSSLSNKADRVRESMDRSVTGLGRELKWRKYKKLSEKQFEQRKENMKDIRNQILEDDLDSLLKTKFEFESYIQRTEDEQTGDYYDFKKLSDAYTNECNRITNKIIDKIGKENIAPKVNSNSNRKYVSALKKIDQTKSMVNNIIDEIAEDGRARYWYFHSK